MKNNENGSGTDLIGESKLTEHVTDTETLTDEDTAELPALDLADFNDVEFAADEATDGASVSRAATSIKDVRGELERLQKRWELLDERLTEANHRVASLQAQVEEKDTKLAALVADLDTMQQEHVTLEAMTVDRDATIASLELALANRGEEVAAVSQSLVEANGRASVFEDRLEAAKHEVEELRRSLQDAKSSEATVSAEKEAVFASQAGLRAKLQDLESYVDGRREKWIEQQAALKSHESEIANLEAALAKSESRFDERNKTIESLQTRINELERESGELEGRHRERGAAQLEAQELLQGRISEIEQLKSELERANDNSGKAELEALKASLVEKDESIRRLEVEISKFEAVKAHIEEQQRTDRDTINELQQEVARLQKELELRSEIIADFNANAEKLNQLSQSMDAADEHTETKFDFSDGDLEHVRHGKHAMDDGDLYNYAAAPHRHAMVALSDASRAVHGISKPVTTIGRSESSDIRINDSVISRLHAILQMDDEGLTIEDHGSKNGVLVNQSRIEQATLKHGDIVSLGKHYLRYVDLEQGKHTH